MKSGFWFDEKTRRWHHAPCWKRVVNFVLRLPQRGRVKWVVFTRADVSLSKPILRGYGFGPILHDPPENK